MKGALLTKRPGTGEPIQHVIKDCLDLIGVGSRGDLLPDGAFQFLYRCAISVNVPASTMTAQWPTPQAGSSAAPQSHAVCASLNVTASIGATT
ncbi:MAG: hypothetical protein WCV00_10455 [Verrucomicrobiia bacterium]|jgi:hypothetical protein